MTKFFREQTSLEDRIRPIDDMKSRHALLVEWFDYAKSKDSLTYNCGVTHYSIICLGECDDYIGYEALRNRIIGEINKMGWQELGDIYHEMHPDCRMAYSPHGDVFLFFTDDDDDSL